jgi:hypothetical protein
MANTNLVTTVGGQRRYLIYYDPAVVTNDVLLSVSQIIVQPDDWHYDQPKETHYSTIMDESTAGYSSLWDIGIAIYQKPATTSILGTLRVKENSTKNYSIPATFDPSGLYNYQWSITGPATITSSSSGKNIDVFFGESGVVKITCTITNGDNGCYSSNLIEIDVGLFFRRMLIARSRF